MDNLENELNNIEKQSHFTKYGSYYSTFTYILIVCLLLFLTYKIYRYFKNKTSNSVCCIQIFNGYYNTKSTNKKSKVSNSRLRYHPMMKIKCLYNICQLGRSRTINLLFIIRINPLQTEI